MNMGLAEMVDAPESLRPVRRTKPTRHHRDEVSAAVSKAESDRAYKDPQVQIWETLTHDDSGATGLPPI